MKLKFMSLVLVFALAAAACGATSTNGSADFDVSSLLIGAGTTTNGAVDIDGTTIEYVTVVPAGFTVGDTAPVALALPPGDQSLGTTRSTVDAVYASEAQRLGWVVVSPAAPGGDQFFDGGEDHLPRFVDWIEAWVTPEGGAPHVVGMSNGGLSAFRYAAENPQRTQSIVAFPGFPRSNGDRDALEELTHVPIMLYVGGDDTPWIGPSQETVAEFGALGGLIELTQFPGEGHVIPSTYDGRIVFNDLESFR